MLKNGSTTTSSRSVWISLFRDREMVKSHRKNKSILPANAFPERKAPLAMAFILPVSRPNQVKIRLVSEKRIRRRRIALTVSADIKEKSHAKTQRRKGKEKGSNSRERR